MTISLPAIIIVAIFSVLAYKGVSLKATNQAPKGAIILGIGACLLFTLGCLWAAIILFT